MGVDTPKIRAVSLISKFTVYDQKKVHLQVQNQMKNPFLGIVQKGTLKKAFKSIGLGIADSIPIVSTIKQNIESNAPDKDTLDIVRIITASTSSVALVYAFYLYSKGELDFEQLNQLIKNLF
jgi:hypothetical protein